MSKKRPSPAEARWRLNHRRRRELAFWRDVEADGDPLGFAAKLRQEGVLRGWPRRFSPTAETDAAHDRDRCRYRDRDPEDDQKRAQRAAWRLRRGLIPHLVQVDRLRPVLQAAASCGAGANSRARGRRRDDEGIRRMARLIRAGTEERTDDEAIQRKGDRRGVRLHFPGAHEAARTPLRQLHEPPSSELSAELERAKQRIAARCRELGIPDRFAPTINLYWSARGYDNAVGKRRQELRMMTTTHAAALERKAFMEIELSCLQAHEQVVTAGLTSQAAQAFIQALPSVETLMPQLSFAEMADEAKPPIAEQLLSSNALRQQRWRERQKALRDSEGALRNAAITGQEDRSA